jgi:two-component system sensor histidine kinase QseC
MLLLLIWPVLAISWAATSLFSYRDAHHEVDELFDAELAQTAKLLVNLYSPSQPTPESSPLLGRNLLSAAKRRGDDHESDHHKKHEHRDREGDHKDHDENHRRRPLAHKYEQEVVYEIRKISGEILERSSASIPDFSSLQTEGFSSLAANNTDWAVYTLVDWPHDLLVHVAQTHRMRTELSGRIARHIFSPLLFFIPLSGLIVAFGASRGLKPLTLLAGAVSERTKDNLKPIHTASVPSEALPLVEALNSLLSRIERALENERRFTSDAAHELRTPIAGMKAQLEVIRDTDSSNDHDIAVQKALTGLDRMSRLTSQLLELARLDQLHELRNIETLDLRALTVEVIAEDASLAVSKSQELSLAEGTGLVQGNSFLVGILIRNLVDNAIRYTPIGGTIQVAVTSTDGKTILEVKDSGPGIPKTEQTSIFDRFVRGRTVTASGSGLGLSIVRRIADLHQAQIELTSAPDQGGLMVRVIFPNGHPAA